jgi:uncharacterized protein
MVPASAIPALSAGPRPEISSNAMEQRADMFDLGSLHMTAGEGRRLDLAVTLGGFDLGGEHYEAEPPVVPVRLDVSRTTADGYALRLRFAVSLAGPCMRCLQDASPSFEIDAREVSQPGGGDELESPYVSDTSPVVLDLRDWARDALALAVGSEPVLCRPDCLGLCAVCGIDLNEAGPDHAHEREPDPRWAKLSELKLD